MKTLSLVEIKTAVTKKKNGIYRKIEWIDGQSVPLSPGVNLTITKTAVVRFGIKYQNTNVVKLEKSIYAASTKEELQRIVSKIKQMPDEVSVCIQPRAMDLLRAKCETVKADREIRTSTPPAGKEVNHDKECPSIIYCKNGNILLQCYKGLTKAAGAAFGQCFRAVETNYYLEKGGKLMKVDKSTITPEQKIKFDKAAAEARRIDGKKTSGDGDIPSIMFTLSTKRIVSIH